MPLCHDRESHFQENFDLLALFQTEPKKWNKTDKVADRDDSVHKHLHIQETSASFQYTKVHVGGIEAVEDQGPPNQSW